MEGILNNIRVLDFGRVLSAPYATLYLADLGADVVKIEEPNVGDDTRSFGPPFMEDVSTYFLSINRGKRSITLDMKCPKNQKIAQKLAMRADILVENFRSDVMDKFNMGAHTLLKKNPRLIYASLTGFGKSSKKPGYDLLIQGLSGITSLNGPAEGENYKYPASIADLIAGMNLAQAILAALYRREKTGKGGIIDVPMIDSIQSLLTYHASAYLNTGFQPRRMGNGHPSIHPFRPYETKNGQLNLCVGNDKIFRKLCCALGKNEFLQDHRFSNNPNRVLHREELNRLLQPIFLQRSKEEWREILQKGGVPCDIVATVPEALQEAHIVEHEHPNGPQYQRVKTLGLPFSIDGEPRTATKRAPRLNEHYEEVLGDWLGNKNV
jgi:formyl-CoA transferase